MYSMFFFFFSSRRRHTRCYRDWSSDVCSSDLVVRLVAEGKDPSNARVNEAMTKQVRSVKEDSTVDEALELMSNAQIRRVPVVNTNNEIVGIVSIGDIAHDTKETGKVGKTVEKISDAPPNK